MYVCDRDWVVRVLRVGLIALLAAASACSDSGPPGANAIDPGSSTYRPRRPSTSADTGASKADGGSGAINSNDRHQWIRSQVNALYFTKFEVTVERYAACVTAGSCTVTPYFGGTTDECNFDEPNRDDHPMNCVFFHEAEEYCAWIGARLPTAEEWEAEASNNGERTYPWGDFPTPACTHAVVDDSSGGGEGCGNGSTNPVGSSSAGESISGLSDMVGNVFEVTTSIHRDGVGRLSCGGSWKSDRVYFRTPCRIRLHPMSRGEEYGFRCVSASGP